MDEVGEKFEIGLFNGKKQLYLMAEYDEEFVGKKSTKVGRYEITCGLDYTVGLAPEINYDVLEKLFFKKFVRIEMKTDRRVRLNCLNWLMNQLKNLDATIVVLLETGKLMKQGSGDSDVRALVVDARDFVLTYTVMVKNGSLEVTIRVLVILKGLKNKTKEFLFEGRHWRMDVDV